MLLSASELRVCTSQSLELRDKHGFIELCWSCPRKIVKRRIERERENKRGRGGLTYPSFNVLFVSCITK